MDRQTLHPSLSVTADTGRLTPRQRIEWMALNAGLAAAGELDALARPPAAVRAARALDGREVDPADLEGRATPSTSPGRLISLHVSAVLMRAVDAHAPAPISVLDVGCGSGGFVPWFRQRLSRFGRYTGVDPFAHEAWEGHADDRVTFRQETAEGFVAGLGPDDDYSLVHSFCALEHIEGDLTVLDGLARWAESLDRPVAQIHHLPGSSTLPLYRWHGYRVYSRADVRRLLGVMPAGSFAVPIGGPTTWWLHLAYRSRDPEAYARRLVPACRRDAGRASRWPIFWCLVSLPPEWLP